MNPLNGNRLWGAAAVVLCATLASFSSAAQQRGAATPRTEPPPAQQESIVDVTKPLGKTRVIDFVATEGTDMSVDVTPDGKWVVFDLLSHIYRVPVGGGEAECLTQDSGIALNYQPRISPDGKSIAFISDRKGMTNLWVMDIDGKNPRPVFLSLTTTLVAPEWTPDGEYIMARGGGSLKKYPKGGGPGVTVTDGARGVAVASRDGKYIYFESSATTETRPMVGNRDLIMGGAQIKRYTIATKEAWDVTAGTDAQNGARNSSGGAIAPELSPDGRWLSFARRIPNGTVSYKGKKIGPRNTLWLHDLKTGAERMVMDPIEMDGAEGTKTLRGLPAYKWTADGNSIVLAQGGKIRKLDVATGAVTTIPFRAKVHRVISEQAVAVTPITDEPFQAKYLLWQSTSPDGSKLAFQAAGRVYVQDLPNGKPHRVTPTSFMPLEYAPAWSPDGQWLAFATFDGIDPGRIWKISVKGGNPVSVTSEPGEYTNPVWSPDGREIVATRGAGVTFEHRPMNGDTWFDLVRIPAAGGEALAFARIAALGGREQMPRASYGPEGRIYFVDKAPAPPAQAGRPAAAEDSEGGARGGRLLVSVKPDGSDRRVDAAFPATDDAVPSPDGKWVAYNEGDHIFVAPMPPLQQGKTPATLNRRNDKSIAMLDAIGGLYPHWRNASTVEFGSSNVYTAYDVNSKTSRHVTVDLKIPRDIPKGTIALTDARIITMRGQEVIERGSIVIKGSRIQCVGNCSTQGADKVISLAGKTIFPGWVDMHGHRNSYSRGLIASRNFKSGSALAHGITTDHDPATWSQAVFATAEMTDAGEVIGPRTYSSAESVSAGDRSARGNPVDSYEELERTAKQIKSWGAVSLKQHPLSRRDELRWWTEAGRKLGMIVTGEGEDLDKDIGFIMDGHTGWEHLLSYTPLYSDVSQFMGQAHAFYSATMVGAGPGIWNEEYFYQQSELWNDKKLQSWEPYQYLVPHTRRRMMRPVTDYSFPIVSQGLADVVAAGGYSPMGQHSRQNALSAHWEVWMLAEGQGAFGALQAASVHSAKYLGAWKDIGSLEVGKLADLIVTDANPLEDIHNTLTMKYVMKGGVLYDSDTLDEQWPRQRAFGKHWWITPDIYRDDDRPTDYWDKQPAH